MRDNKYKKTHDRKRKAKKQSKRINLHQKPEPGTYLMNDLTKTHWDIDKNRLDYAKELELPFNNARFVTVREYVGFPDFKTLQNIETEQIRTEVKKVLAYLLSHNIAVDFLTEVPDDDAYDFLTNELMDQEIENIRIPDMSTCFIYEDFHPNDKLDAEMFAELFLHDLFEMDEDSAINSFDEMEVYDRNGKRISFLNMSNNIHAFLSNHITFTSYKFECLKCSISEGYATVIFQSEWAGLKKGAGFSGIESVSYKGESKLRLKKSPYGCFDLIQINLIGWN